MIAILSETTKSARFIAMLALDEFDQAKNRLRAKGVYAGDILDKFLDRTNQKQRATDLVFGVIRNHAAIKIVLSNFVECPVSRIAPKLRNIIRIAAYELIYRPETTDYSIINEAVENAKKISAKKHAGFVNALLRKLTRAIKNRKVPLSKADSKSTLPQDTSFGCEFIKSFLPDYTKLPADYLSIAFSLPKWLIEGWRDDFEIYQARQICFASNRKPSIYLRPNILKTSTYHLAEILSHEGINFKITSDEKMIKLKSSKSVTKLPGFDEGLFSVQDFAAAKPIQALYPQPGQKILDLCAAPGAKVTQIAELTSDKAEIVATDINENRLKKLENNISRLGIESIKKVFYDPEKILKESGLFDIILLDVPCSNTAVLAKRPEVRLKIKANIITKLKETQLQLLNTASRLIKPSGKICYCTCSLQKEENTQCVETFLSQSSGFKLELQLLTLPCADGFDHDGSYYAIISKP